MSGGILREVKATELESRPAWPWKFPQDFLFRITGFAPLIGRIIPPPSDGDKRKITAAVPCFGTGCRLLFEAFEYFLHCLVNGSF